MTFSTILKFISSSLVLVALSLVVHASANPAAYPNQLTREEIFASPPSLPSVPAIASAETLEVDPDDTAGEIVLQEEKVEESVRSVHMEEVERITPTPPPLPPSTKSQNETEIEVVADVNNETEPVVIEQKEVEPDVISDQNESKRSPAEQEQFLDQIKSLPIFAGAFFDSNQDKESKTLEFILPKVEVNSEIIRVPIEDGSWVLDDLDDQVGILQGGGEFPGDDYSMIFAGHVTTRWPWLGPFGRLKNFSLGDEVVYQDGEHTFTYEITRFIYAHPSRVDLLFQQERDQIVLVTCNGYDLLTDTFEERLVSYATLVKVTALDAPEVELPLDLFR